MKHMIKNLLLLEVNIPSILFLTHVVADEERTRRQTANFRSPGLHLEVLRDPSSKTRIHFYLYISHPHSCTHVSSDVPRHLHLDQMSWLVPGGAIVFAEPTLSVELKSIWLILWLAPESLFFHFPYVTVGGCVWWMTDTRGIGCAW